MATVTCPGCLERDQRIAALEHRVAELKATVRDLTVRLGARARRGCRFVERMLTVVQTQRLQGRSVLGYLYDALVAHRSGRPAPSLLSAE